METKMAKGVHFIEAFELFQVPSCSLMLSVHHISRLPQVPGFRAPGGVGWELASHRHHLQSELCSLLGSSKSRWWRWGENANTCMWESQAQGGGIERERTTWALQWISSHALPPLHPHPVLAWMHERACGFVASAMAGCGCRRVGALATTYPPPPLHTGKRWRDKWMQREGRGCHVRGGGVGKGVWLLLYEQIERGREDEEG